MFEKTINYYTGIEECRIDIKTNSSGRYQFEVNVSGRSYSEVKPIIDKAVWELTELINDYNKQIEEKKTQTKLSQQKK